MKSTKFLVVATVSLMSIAPSVLLAASNSASSKKVVTIDESSGDLVEVTPLKSDSAGTATASNSNSATAAPAPIVILNNQKTTASATTAQKAVQEQPAAVIEDSPITSSADRRRRERQAMEVQTESKIVEKLEEARIEDEKKRADKLFNRSLTVQETEKKAETTEVKTVVVTPIKVVQPEPQVEERSAKREEKVNVKEEIRAAFDEMKSKEKQNVGPNQFYVSGMVGVANYPDYSAVRSDVSTGFTLGVVTADRLIGEGSFQYSNFDISNGYYNNGYSYTPNLIPYAKMSQYNFGAAIKYQLLGGNIRPVIGAAAGYTYRSYSNGNSYYGYSSTGNPSTNAFDIGVVGGVDIQLTPNFAVGVDFRYMKNIAHRENSDYNNSFAFPRVGKIVEDYDYYIGALSGKFTF